MDSRHFLHRKNQPRTKRKAAGRPTVAGLLELLGDQVVDRLARMGLARIQAVALVVGEPNEEEPVPNPSHPACREFSSSDYCRESWQLHLAKLKRRPETHWGVCQHDIFCAIIPVVCEQRCLAVIKLAGPASLDKAEFARLVELLEVLVKDFTTCHAEFLRRVPGGLTANARVHHTRTADHDGGLNPHPAHPQVRRALDYIAMHLSDPRLTVAHAASVLGVCPTYLSEIFVEHTGHRMSRFIAARRVELAKELLATTDWQIKRIALETGHANPNWFCHIFSAHTGVTPSEYRAVARAQRSNPTGR